MVWKAVVKLMTMVHCGTAMYRCGLCVTPAAGDISVPGQIGHQTAYHDPMKSCLSPRFCIPIPHLGGQASSLNCHTTMAVLLISPHFHHPTPCLPPPSPQVGDADHQHCRQHRRPRQRIREPLPRSCLVQRRRPGNGAAGSSHHAMEAGEKLGGGRFNLLGSHGWSHRRFRTDLP